MTITASAIAAEGSEACEFERGLPPQWDLQPSSDHPGDSIVARGKRLWNVIAPDGQFRGQLLLSDQTPT